MRKVLLLITFSISSICYSQSISGGEFHSLAICNDHIVWGWGLNKFSQLGSGTTNTTSNIPVTVSSLPSFEIVDAGYYHTLVLKVDGTVWAWGGNTNGQLGIGNTTSSNVPVQVNSLSNIIAIATGGNYSLALKSDSSIWAWGTNLSGQLGNGTYTESHVPIQVLNLCFPNTTINEVTYEKFITVTPSPFTSVAMLEVSTTLDLTNASFEMYNVLGERVKQFAITNPKSEITRDNLPSGIYLWRVISPSPAGDGRGEVIGSGKVVVE